MSTTYRPGIKDIAAYIFGAVFSGAALFHIVFIRPLAVGDRVGPTGGERTWLGLVLSYAVLAFMMLYCICETILMIRTRRNLKRDPNAQQDLTAEQRASTSDIVGRILGALFCGICLLYFVFISPLTVGNDPQELMESASGFHLPTILFYSVFVVLGINCVFETVMMLRTRSRRRS